MNDTQHGGGGQPPSGPTFLGHPRGLATLFMTEFFERFTYYGMRALLVLFLVAATDGANPGFGIDRETAGAVYGLYTGAVFLGSLPGGWIADRLIGQRRAVFWGGIIIALGNFILAIPATPGVFYLGLATIVIGVGLLKPNISAIVGALYEGQPGARRDHRQAELACQAVAKIACANGGNRQPARRQHQAARLYRASIGINLIAARA